MDKRHAQALCTYLQNTRFSQVVKCSQWKVFIKDCYNTSFISQGFVSLSGISSTKQEKKISQYSSTRVSMSHPSAKLCSFSACIPSITLQLNVSCLVSFAVTFTKFVTVICRSCLCSMHISQIPTTFSTITVQPSFRFSYWSDLVLIKFMFNF